MTETVRFDRRFQGFEHGALGGYAAGVVAARIDGPAEANLRSLPQMERDLEIRKLGEGLELWDGETLVLEALPASFDLAIPETPSLAKAKEAASRLIHDETGHLYPSCFTCGPDRDEGDGLRLFMGRLDPEGELLASAWTPDPALGAEDGALPAEMVWAALDCPTIWAGWARSYPAEAGEGFTVLARQRLDITAPVPTGEPVIVTAWPIEQDGRKHLCGAAIADADGRPLARAESLLIAVPARR